jgi:hypothetical protein
MCVANNSPDIRELLLMFNKQLSAGFLKIIVGVLTDATCLAISFSRCNPMKFISMGLRQESRFMFVLFPQVSRN